MPPAHSNSRQPFTLGFTLVEVLFTMAIFAVGFAAIAIMLPAGFILQREVQSDTDGFIVSNNAAEIVKAKGCHSATQLFLRGGRCMDVEDINGVGVKLRPVYGSAYATNQRVFTPNWIYSPYTDVWTSGHPLYGGSYPWPSRSSNWDMEGCVFNWKLRTGAKPQGAPISTQVRPQGLLALVPYLDTNKNTYLWGRNDGQSNPHSVFEDEMQAEFNVLDQDDGTSWSNGRIHYFKNRPVPGFSHGYFSPLDFSYPSSVLDVSARTYIARVLLWNQSTNYEAGALGKADWGCQDSALPDWRLMVCALRMNTGDEWPELGDGNVANTGYLFYNDTVAMRSVGKPPASFGSTWNTYGMVDVSGRNPKHITTRWPYPAPATGGDPGNPRSAYQVGALAGAKQSASGSSTDPVGRGWFFSGTTPNFPKYKSMPVSLAGVTVRDPAFTGANYQGYSVPSLVRCYAVVYDYANDLLLLRYPRVYGTASSGDARTADFFSKYPAAATTDRRLKVSDSFLSSPGGIPMQVREVLDPVAAGLAAPGAPDWSDGTYQVIRVTPSLNTTPYTPNKPCILTSTMNTEKNDPPLYQVLMAPAPIAGGRSPWYSITVLPQANAQVFRLNNQMAD